MLQERYPIDRLHSVLKPRQGWHPFPIATNREAWKALTQYPLNQARKARFIGQAELYLGQPWSPLSAVRYMDYGRNGNRTRYQEFYFERRDRLSILVLAECFEHKGRFIDEIINGLWLICEETTWVIPAHSIKASCEVLPILDGQTVDLFASQTALVLALVYDLLQDELDAVSPVVGQRIRQQIDTQVLEPVEERIVAKWWDGHNNWTPWICSNCLGAALLTWDDPDRVARYVHRLMEPVDNFLNDYADEGGCDEGPSYWSRAAGTLLIFLDLLYDRSDGQIDVYDEQKIKAMGEYFAYAHLDGPWFTNYADAPANCRVQRGVTYRYGERVGSNMMRDTVLMQMHNWQADGEIEELHGELRGDGILQMLAEMFWIPGDAKPFNLPRPIEAWYPDIQMAVVRSSDVADNGLVMAIKGNHNGESHNHNDVGHFVVMLNGEPGIIDLGTEDYTAQTFGPRRYELWCTRANGHNMPMFDGIEQTAGGKYAAKNVSFMDDGALATFRADIAGAYPAETGLTSLVRTATFDRNAVSAVIEDVIVRGKPTKVLELYLYSWKEPRQIGPGCISIATAPQELGLGFDSSLFTAEIKEMPVTDHKLGLAWGDRVYRIKLTASLPAGKTAYKLTFTPR